MKMNYKTLFILLFTIMTAVSAQAQIAPKVIEVLKKSQQTISNPQGTEVDMTVDVTMVVKLTGMKIKTLEKNNKMRMYTESKVLGKELAIEAGFDGQQEWEYTHWKDDEDAKARRDSLIIKKTTKKPKYENTVDFEMYKNYKVGTVKLNGQNYEITLIKPIKEKLPSKVVMLVDKDKYLFREMKTKTKGVSVSMKMTKIKIGVSDDAFKLDLKKYPKAVVVRK